MSPSAASDLAGNARRLGAEDGVRLERVLDSHDHRARISPATDADAQWSRAVSRRGNNGGGEQVRECFSWGEVAQGTGHSRSKPSSHRSFTERKAT